MPAWTQEHIEPPWSKPHTIQLSAHEVYDRAVANGGSDKIARHAPLSLAGGQGRKAGTSGAHTGQDAVHGTPAGETNGYVVHDFRSVPEGVSREDWEDALKDSSRAVNVREVKLLVPDFKVTFPKHHAFARYLLPVKSTAFADQGWPGKKQQEQNQSNQRKEDKSSHEEEPQMTPMQKYLLDRLLEEMQIIRSFENNDGEPEGGLKLLDTDALEQLESGVRVEDQMTPDSWVPRSAKLLRLTGTHPLNAEPNVTELFDAGMVTPTKLHYVRSHGAVPQLSWETHRVHVFSSPRGIIAQPKEWTMDEIAHGEFRIHEIPVTIACDGNRRKEMNMSKQTAGVGFSAAGVSTCMWRGVHVRDVLLACGLQDQPEKERWFINFEGADECSEGTYATSIPLMHAMDVNNDVLLVFGQNGRVLHPDHGYPLRALIPGHVGGRQVKWVEKIWVSKVPNSSYYHIWDNRVIPGFITSKDDPLAIAFHHHESTACMEQTLQSVICKPAHNELILLPREGEDGRDDTYRVQGFAYNGGGHAIIRVELTLDGGKTWKYCFKRYLPKPLRYGEKHWAWIFWSCEVPLRELVNSSEMAVRAMDSKMQTQPEHMSWNMTGMMNNCWYRLRHNMVTDPKTGRAGLKFMHPIAPGQDDSGWMKPNPADMQTKDEPNKTDERIFSLEEIAKHNNKDDAWLILENKVYDVTDVLSWHPGGASAILAYAGKATVDATIQYKNIHDNYAHSKRDECYIGRLSDEAVEEMKKDAKRAEETLAKIRKERAGCAVQPDVFTRATLVKRREVSKDTRTYVFALPKRENGENGILKLPVGKHLMLSIHFNDQAVLRPYTPVAPVLPKEEDGTFTLCVKTYFPTDGGPYPPGGLVSNYLDCLEEGEEIDVRGPEGGITYKGHGRFEVDGKEHHFDKINLVAGGSGLTPHWQLIHAIIADPDDKTKISLIDCNKTYEDILLHDELQNYADQCPDRFRLWHVVSKAPDHVGWKFGQGLLDQKLMKEHFYPPGRGTATFLCGPPGLIEHAAIPGLEKMGFKTGVNVFGF